MYGGHVQVADLDLSGNAPSYFAITDVNVLSPTADSFSSGQTVVVDGETIVSVGVDIELAEGTPTIDGNGMFLVPGFIDSHVHLWESENDLLLYVANGVTQVREMNGLPIHMQWKKEIAAGRLGPELFVVAPQFATFDLFEGLFVGWTQHKTIVRSASQVNQAVEFYVNEGYDAVKASSYLDGKGYVALSEAAKENAIPLVGHIPMAVGLDDVWRSNQAEIAHVEELMKALDREFGGYGHENAEEFLEFVRSRSDDVADHLIETGISVTSTLTLIDSFHQQKSNLDAVLGAAALEYESPGIAEGTVITSRGMGWLPGVNIYRWPSEWGDERRANSLIYWKTYSNAQHIVFDALLKKGVSILAGTDANVPVMVPGFSLHAEMKALNDSGMSTAQVIASATTIPARFMKTRTGKIRPGFKANLVLLRENPLNDIDAIESIEMVIVKGERLIIVVNLGQIRIAKDVGQDAPLAPLFGVQFATFAAFPAAIPFGLVFPVFGIANARFGFDVIEPSVFNAFAAGPNVFTGHRTSVTPDTFIKVQHHAYLCANFHSAASVLLAGVSSQSTFLILRTITNSSRFEPTVP